MVRYVRAGLAGWLIAAAICTATAQDFPPTIQIVDWTVFRPSGGSFPGVNPGSFVHQEFDLVQVTCRIEDGDWTLALNELNMQQPGPGGTPPDPPDYEEVFMKVDITGFPVALPVAPVIIQVGVAWDQIQPSVPENVGEWFGAVDDTTTTSSGFVATQDNMFGDAGPPFTLVVIDILVPQLLGPSQRRLDPSIGEMFDVNYLLQISVSNEDGPDPEPFPAILQPFGVIVSPALSPPNPPPFPDAAASSRLVQRGTTVTLDGSRTFDASNVGFDPSDENIFVKDILTYTWEWISGPERVDPVQDKPTDPTATVVLNTVTPADGSNPYVYRLIVNDGSGNLPVTSTVEINVVDSLPPNNPPTATIVGPGAAIPVGQVVQLDGSASSDPDGDPLTYRWQQVNSLGDPLSQDELQQSFQALSGLTSPTTQWQAVMPGTYFFRLLVSDGQSTASATFSIEVVEDATAGATVTTEQLLARANAAADATDQQPAATPASSDQPVAPDVLGPPRCGFGLLPVAFAPLTMVGMRRRRR